jgi:hypothetical protein
MSLRGLYGLPTIGIARAGNSSFDAGGEGGEMVKRSIMLLAIAAAALASAAVASGAGITSSLFGGAVQEQSDVKLVSDLTNTTSADDFSGITFTLPVGTTFSQLTQLSTEFNPTVGGCGGGSPRFTLHLSSGKNVFVYLGPSPNFTGCALNTWQSSGNLIGNNDTGRYDTSQVMSGTQSNTYTGALSLIGAQTVTSIDLVVDSGWFFNPKMQTVLVRNVQINGQTFVVPQKQQPSSPSPARACKAELATLGRSAFEHKYGSNHNLRNALGKCVSRKAHQHH